VSSTMKMVGDLIFNKLEGIIKHKRTNEVLAKFPVRFAHMTMLHTCPRELAIDSKGVKANRGFHIIHKEFYEQAKAAFFGAYLDPPTATDAVVHIELYDETDGAVIEFLEFAGEGGYKEKMLPLPELIDKDKHYCRVRFNVVAASATSGATQVWDTAWIIVIYDFSK